MEYASRERKTLQPVLVQAFVLFTFVLGGPDQGAVHSLTLQAESCKKRSGACVLENIDYAFNQTESAIG